MVTLGCPGWGRRAQAAGRCSLAIRNACRRTVRQEGGIPPRSRPRGRDPNRRSRHPHRNRNPRRALGSTGPPSGPVKQRANCLVVGQVHVTVASKSPASPLRAGCRSAQNRCDVAPAARSWYMELSSTGGSARGQVGIGAGAGQGNVAVVEEARIRMSSRPRCPGRPDRRSPPARPARRPA